MRAWLVCVALVLPCAAGAEPATVQSGEHATFSRLVTILRSADWAVSQRGREVVLEFPGHSDGFDISTVFERMPRSRIQSISASDSQMRLTLNCDCAVSAFLEKDAFVVIDVAADARALQTKPLLPEPEPARTEGPDAPVAPAETATALARPIPRPAREDATPYPAYEAALPDPVERLSPQAQQVLADVESRLASELETAALRGLLTSDPDTPLPGAKRPQIDISSFETAVPTEPERAPARDQPLTNMRVTTSRDVPGTSRAATVAPVDRGRVCPADADFDVSNWGTEAPFADQIGTARQGLYGEFDRLDAKVALRIVRSYLYFGFGAEARDILRLDPTLAQMQAHLIPLSHLVEGDHPGPENALSGLAECEGPTSLWAVLALPDPPAGALPDSNAALRSLNGLPDHLRQSLAPMLSRVLLNYGDPEGAASALRSLERLPTDLPSAAKLAKAEVAMRDGKVEAGAQQLEEVVEDNTQQSPKALIALVKAKMAQDQPISAETAGLLEAYASELRGSELGPELRRAHVIALTRSGQFDRAYRAAAELGGNADNAAANTLRKLMLHELVASAGDIVFLDHAFDLPDRALRDLPPEDQTALARRYFDLGFAPRAEMVIGLMSDRDRHEPTRLLAARISMAMGKPFKAQADLLGLETPEADLLRADAKRMAGAHSEARALYTQAERPQEARDSALLAGDLAALAPEIATATGAVEGGEGMLSRSTALLEQSNLARQSLSALLDQPDLRFEMSNWGYEK